jgi:hypothetical protein
MKTPMQELIERLNNVKPTEFCSIETIKGWAEEIFEKETEKEKMNRVWNDSRRNMVRASNGFDFYTSFEDYYNETYGGNK